MQVLRFKQHLPDIKQLMGVENIVSAVFIFYLGFCQTVSYSIESNMAGVNKTQDSWVASIPSGTDQRR